MSDERDPERDPDTAAFDPDEWFRTQFTTQPPTEPAPTQLSDIVEPAPTQLSDIIAPATTALGDAATELMRQPEEGGALDELFSTTSFQEYHEPLIPIASRSTGRGDGTIPPIPTPRAPRAPLGRSQKTLLWVAGSLGAVLALVLIFFLGTRIPQLLGPAPGAEPTPTPSSTPTPTPTPTATERPVGPVAAGEYRWDELGGGECLEPFVNAWQETYTVVDCAEPHAAQLFDRAPFGLPEGAAVPGAFPGEEALAAQISLLCSRPGALDLVAAAPFADIQVQGAYAVTEEQWNGGMTDFFCFVSRSSGEPLTGSLVPVG